MAITVSAFCFSGIISHSALVCKWPILDFVPDPFVKAKDNAARIATDVKKYMGFIFISYNFKVQSQKANVS